jgi:hypothetical protein
MNAYRVAVVGLRALVLLLPQADRAAPIAAEQVVDRLASLALDLVNPSPAKRSQQLTVEGQAPVKRADDEVQVVDTAHAAVLATGRRVKVGLGRALR